MDGKLKATKLVKDIEGYLHDLEKYLPLDEEMLAQDREKEYLVSFLLEQIANECMNIGNNAISAFDLPLPQHGKDIFDILEKEHFIQKAVAEYMKQVVAVRNVIAHRYIELSREELVDVLEQISLVEEFLTQLLNGIEKRENGRKRR